MKGATKDASSLQPHQQQARGAVHVALVLNRRQIFIALHAVLLGGTELLCGACNLVHRGLRTVVVLNKRGAIHGAELLCSACKIVCGAVH